MEQWACNQNRKCSTSEQKSDHQRRSKLRSATNDEVVDYWSGKKQKIKGKNNIHRNTHQLLSFPKETYWQTRGIVLFGNPRSSKDNSFQTLLLNKTSSPILSTSLTQTCRTKKNNKQKNEKQNIINKEKITYRKNQ